MNRLPASFASSDRTDDELILEHHKSWQHQNSLPKILDSIPSASLVVNEHRQVVFANKNLTELIGASGIDRLLGKRPGEILDCINANREPGGCGTSEYCQQCGAAQLLVKALSTGIKSSGECRITSGKGAKSKAWDFYCVATPLQLNNDNYILLSLLDISHEKRRRAIERIFFHDVINIASSLDGFIDFIREVDQQDITTKQIEIIHRLSKNLLDEILAQRQLCDAENDELMVRKEQTYSLDLVSEVVNALAHHPVAGNKEINTEPDSDNVCLFSDPTLIKRVLINMLKNALEACNDGDEANIGSSATREHVVFWVQNPGVIAPDVQKQIFQRSFSTKAADRGLGTYSMRLITEKYLNGKIAFQSDAEKGTIFRLTIPIASHQKNNP